MLIVDFLFSCEVGHSKEFLKCFFCHIKDFVSNQLKHLSTSKISDFAKKTFFFFSCYTILCFFLLKGQKTDFHVLQHVSVSMGISNLYDTLSLFCTPLIPGYYFSTNFGPKLFLFSLFCGHFRSHSKKLMSFLRPSFSVNPS